MYNSPIKIFENAMQEQIQEKENQIFTTIKSQIAVDVDKDELLKALRYDRHQYEQGYEDGVMNERQHWINWLTWLMNHPTAEV
ncbi:MAG: hypothetical protein J6R32_11260 [Bacteroidales bacterium]|nr:hypothetical protein [Bacteroidales bacterium]